jgi:antitoxin ParD1/3/4
LKKWSTPKSPAGLYNDAAEVVRESLRFMQLHEEWIYQLKLEQLKNQLQIGIRQLDAGDSVSMDAIFFKS